MAAETYTTNTELKKYMNAANAINDVNPVGTLPPDTYIIYKRIGNAYNLSKTSNSAGAWVDVTKDVKLPGKGKKFNVHAGHNPDGKVACGASGFILESTEARNIIFWLKYYLEKMGAVVYDCTCNNGTSQQDVLNKIVAKDNAHDVNASISIHFNSGRNDKKGDNKVGGYEMYVTSYSSEKLVWTNQIFNKLKDLGFAPHGNAFKDKSHRSLYYLNHTKAKAMLLEVCFVDDKDDAEWYKKTGAEQIGKAIAEGLLGV